MLLSGLLKIGCWLMLTSALVEFPASQPKAKLFAAPSRRARLWWCGARGLSVFAYKSGGYQRWDEAFPFHCHQLIEPGK